MSYRPIALKIKLDDEYNCTTADIVSCGLLFTYADTQSPFFSHYNYPSLTNFLTLGVLVVAVTLLFDLWMYGSCIFVPLIFLKFSFLSSGGDYYGAHKWHWYFTQGFSAMLLSFLPFSIVGIFKSKEWGLSGLIAWVLGVFSMLGHKEFRFVLPVLPIALMFSAYSLEIMSRPDLSD